MYLASSHEQVINDYYGVEACRMYSVSVLDSAGSDPAQENPGRGNLLHVECSASFWQYPSTVAKPLMTYPAVCLRARHDFVVSVSVSTNSEGFHALFWQNK